MKNYLPFVIGCAFFLNVISCAPIVSTDFKSFQENPEKYQSKSSTIKADIKNVAKPPAILVGRKVELTGYVVLEGFKTINDWSFLLKDDEGHQVWCYERTYRVTGWIAPEMALREAAHKKEKITVLGRFEQSGKIELEWIEYKGQHYDTDYFPPGIWLPPSF